MKHSARWIEGSEQAVRRGGGGCVLSTALLLVGLFGAGLLTGLALGPIAAKSLEEGEAASAATLRGNDRCVCVGQTPGGGFGRVSCPSEPWQMHRFWGLRSHLICFGVGMAPASDL